jgi:hypothetical protein
MYLMDPRVLCVASQQNEYYGQDFASFPLSALQDWAHQQQQPQAQAPAEALTAGCESITILHMLKHVTATATKCT